MGFFDFLKNKASVEWKKTLLKDLVMLTAVDGDMDKDEIKEVLKIAVNELGFSENEFINIMQNLGKVKDIYPTEMKNKQIYLEKLIKITYADGYVDENEIRYFKIIAKKMNLDENTIGKIISSIENSDSNDESETGKVIITSPFNPTVDIQSEEGLNNYFIRISNLSKVDLCIEFSNVMAAKHNKMVIPSGISSFSETQKVVTDLTDKALTICIVGFGRESILNYCNQDVRKFNELVNKIDSEVATLKLDSANHGKEMFERIYKVLSR